VCSFLLKYAVQGQGRRPFPGCGGGWGPHLGAYAAHTAAAVAGVLHRINQRKALAVVRQGDLSGRFRGSGERARALAADRRSGEKGAHATADWDWKRGGSCGSFASMGGSSERSSLSGRIRDCDAAAAPSNTSPQKSACCCRRSGTRCAAAAPKTLHVDAQCAPAHSACPCWQLGCFWDGCMGLKPHNVTLCAASSCDVLIATSRRRSATVLGNVSIYFTTIVGLKVIAANDAALTKAYHCCRHSELASTHPLLACGQVAGPFAERVRATCVPDGCSRTRKAHYTRFLCHAICQRVWLQ
jgi:hypothetical protein